MRTFSALWLWHRALVAGLAVLVACGLIAGNATAEEIKVGMLKTAGGGPVFIGIEKGYFASESLTATPVFFETAQPVATAAVAGGIDLGTTGVTAALYNLAGQGAVKIVGGYTRETPGFHGGTSYVVSNRAYAAGLKSFKDFPGHSVALPVLGSPPHYSLSLLAEKYGLDIKTMRLMQLQTNANQVSAVSGGEADIGLIQGLAALPAIQRGDIKLVGWVGEETPWQLGAIFASTKTANERRDMVERFLRAYRKGARDYYDAFVGPDGQHRDGPTAPETLALMSKYVGQSPEVIELGLNYLDRDTRLDVKDIAHQIEWYRSQGFVKSQFDAAAIIDQRYVVPLP